MPLDIDDIRELHLQLAMGQLLAALVAVPSASVRRAMVRQLDQGR